MSETANTTDFYNDSCLIVSSFHIENFAHPRKHMTYTHFNINQTFCLGKNKESGNKNNTAARTEEACIMHQAWGLG